MNDQNSLESMGISPEKQLEFLHKLSGVLGYEPALMTSSGFMVKKSGNESAEFEHWNPLENIKDLMDILSLSGVSLAVFDSEEGGIQDISEFLPELVSGILEGVFGVISSLIG